MPYFLGTVSACYILGLVGLKAYQWGLNVEWSDVDSVHYVPLFKPSFTVLTGVLSLGYFIHNCVVSVMRHNKVQENNVSRHACSFQTFN